MDSNLQIMKLRYIVILIVLGGFIFFASRISTVYPPIKEYKFQTTASDLRLSIIKTLENQDKFEYKFTDTVGNEQNGYAYYIDLRIKDRQIDNNYTFKYYDEERFLGKIKTSKIDLIGAFDKIHNTGGYKLKDTDVPKLISIFDVEFIDKIIHPDTVVVLIKDRVVTTDTIIGLLDTSLTTDTIEFHNSEPFLFFKSGRFLDKTEKNAIWINCPTDTTYSLKLYLIRDNKWVMADSITGLDAFPSQFDPIFDDFNFDKQNDIFIQASASNGWSLSRGHLLIVDPQTKKLTLHKEARDLANMNPDPKTKTVTSEIWNGYNGKGQNQLTIFTNKWMDGKLKTVKKKDITIN